MGFTDICDIHGISKDACECNYLSPGLQDAIAYGAAQRKEVPDAPMFMGIDLASKEGDASGIAIRVGREMKQIMTFPEDEPIVDACIFKETYMLATVKRVFRYDEKSGKLIALEFWA